MTMPDARRAAVIGGNRIPVARARGAYAGASASEMLTAALDGLAARVGLAGERLGEVVGGAVLKHSRDRDLTREAVLGSSLSATTPAYDLQQACATGLETVISVANKIALGQIESGVAAGPTARVTRRSLSTTSCAASSSRWRPRGPCPARSPL